MFDKSSKDDKTETVKKPAASTVSGGSASGGTTTIGASVNIRGEISGSEDLVIQGTVEGSINLKDHSVSVGEKGRIQADIFAKNIIVEGDMTGDMQGTEKVTVTHSGKVRGNITAPRVVLEDGASFKGSIDMDAKPGTPAKTADVGGTGAVKSKLA